MDTQEKLELLSEASQYDLACACGTSDQDRRRRGRDGAWLYPVPLPQGGSSVLLKTLLSNACTNDCKYCPYRTTSDTRRCTIEPEEIARVFMDYLRRKKVFGLFLSSGVNRDPDFTMEKLNQVARILRRDYDFKGYIHLKVIPGASDAAIEEAVALASAVSVNIEIPGERHLAALSSTKRYREDIIRPLTHISRLTARGSRYARVKQTTQFVVGASDETDTEIVRYAFALYDRLHLHRLYFSAYQQGLGTPDIPGERTAPTDNVLVREHRLYQVDFLIRKYGFKESEIPFDEAGNLSLQRDPKQIWADTHPEFFPLRIRSASREELLRVPGLGPITVGRILRMRRAGRIGDPADLKLTGARREKVLAYLVFE
jgi:predicted DNA-binding helix-hairpin-helix protein